MQKKILRRIILLFLLAGIVFACMDEDSWFRKKDSLPPEVAEAQAWYMSHADGLQLKALGNDELILLTPDWKKSFSSGNDSCKVVEINLISENNTGFASPECSKKFEEKEDMSYLASNIRLIVRTDKGTGETDGFIMIACPDLSYAEKNKSHSLENISYLERDKDFSGLVLYYDMEGNFVNGWQYVDGIAYVFHPAEKKNPGEPELRYMSCFSIYQTVYTYTDAYVYNEYQYTLVSSSQVYVGSFCYETGGGGYGGGGGSSGGGGGGSTTNSTPASYAPKASKIFRNSNMTKENWEKLERMINKIIENCMGNALYSGLTNYLNGKTLTFQYNTGSGSSFQFDGSTAGISLGMDASSNNLFHEMWHAYQAYQETWASYYNSTMNTEIEARYAQYLYIRSLNEYVPGSKWAKMYTDNPINKSIGDLEIYVDKYGKLQPGASSELLETYILNNPVAILKNSDNYNNTIYDYQRTGIQNFNNLKNLTVNCNF
jgi:hypothetical protein